jgi:hypothetical protein
VQADGFSHGGADLNPFQVRMRHLIDAEPEPWRALSRALASDALERGRVIGYLRASA